MIKKNQILPLLAAILIPQVMGGLGAVATASSVSTWYRQIRKPSWTPPSSIFGPVWTTLYLLMGVASWLVWRRGQREFGLVRPARSALGLYSVQLVLNSLWSIIFFGFRSTGWALAELLVLWGLIGQTMVRFSQINRTAGILLLPYFLWTTFAGALNYSIWSLNREQST